MKRKIIVPFVFLLVSVIITGCGTAHEINLNMNDSGSSIEAKKGDVLVITLEANATTGYTWDVSDNNEYVTKYAGKKYLEPEKTNPPKIGTPSKEVLRFNAIKKGTSDIKLIYHQPWENKVKPVRTFYVNITVR